MKKTLFQKVICLILSVTTLFGIVGVSSSAATGSAETSYGSNKDTAADLEQMQALVGVSTYAEYLAEYGDPNTVNANTELESISIDVVNNMLKDSDGIVAKNSTLCNNSFAEDQTKWISFGEENWEKSVYLNADGDTTWTFNVPNGKAGYYYIKFTYFTAVTDESSITSIERKLFIDGEAPFDEASCVTFNKSWEYVNYTVSDPVPTDKEDGVTVTYDHKSKDGYYKYVSNVVDGMETVTTYKIAKDINGNSMAPSVEQVPAWNTYYCQDTTGYYTGYFCFYLLNGDHQITLAAQRDPLIISGIELIPYEPGTNSLPKYEDVLKDYQDKGYVSAEGGAIRIEAEFPDFVSDSSVYATNDNTSAQTYPSVSKSQLYNVIGENSYDTVGQWAAYKFSVNSTGLYKLSMRYLQNALQGMYICRTIRLSGGIYGLKDEYGTPSVPFEEAYDAQFAYNKDWQSSYIGDSKGNIFEFYFEEGVEYTLYIECSLGSLGTLISEVEETLEVINDCYLKILKVTGSAPDEYTYYKFEKIMPDVLRNLLIESMELERIKNELQALCGTNGSHIATLQTISDLLDTMGSNEGWDIAANMSNLKSYLGTLGTWINDSKKGSMMIDCINICPTSMTNKDLPKKDANFFKALWFEIKSFIYSFSTNYEAMGMTEKPSEDTVTIDVWLASGRDQTNIWRSMLDAQGGFTDTTGYGVALKLVTGGTLLPSILSGKGPDVYMGIGASDVINYAIRDAIICLTEEEIFNTTYYTYKDADGEYTVTTDDPDTVGMEPIFVSNTYDDHVKDNFVQAALDTLTLLGKSYGVPQTMAFPMMFYRMDVLAELKEDVPETWEELLKMLPTLQSNNMSMGVSYALAYNALLYQSGGSMWKYIGDDEYAGAKVDLDSNTALTAFEFVCRLYTDYSFPVSYDSANRFRTGEMPLLIGSYEDLYNKLVVYATEIEGLWSICPLPGTKLADGTINYDTICTVSATVMLHGCDDMLPAWEYIQWQTSAKVQADYGNKMVALIGPSAKYETANINAIKDLSWTASERAAIEDQIKHMSSIVNYPGSYYITRYIQFAFLDAVNDDADAVDALNGYIDAINAEITRKRSEFKLKTLAADEEPPEKETNQ